MYAISMQSYIKNPEKRTFFGIYYDIYKIK